MIEVDNLQKSYSDTPVLKNINLRIEAGEIYGLVGRSGAGKSTLLRCINGLEQYDGGALRVEGFDIRSHSEKEIRNFRKNIGMIFQHFSLMERRTVYQNVALPLECWGYPSAEIDRRVKELLRLVDLEDKMSEKPRALSGGQKQRVAIARALSLNPKILLCDEATSALDPKTTSSILQLLRRINETFGIAIVVVTHQMSVVRQLCHKVSILEDGEITASGSVSQIFLNQPQSLKNLLGDEETELSLTNGAQIKISYQENDANSTWLSDMARTLDIHFAISRASLEPYRDAVLGTIVIRLDETQVSAVTAYLSKLDVTWEVIRSDGK
ncbi:methionine ABC transporter ATP-binding protein [Azotosporobacter soli]|uniref:methionine ABC transporter ATP-binding protein n=1 Tax=Azotosporobacter soli TaxID=3055040 RepID=UPI0031FF39B5